MYPKTAPGGPHTAHYVQLSHFIYFSPSSASTEEEYGILDTTFTASVFCVVSGFFYFHPQCQSRRHLHFTWYASHEGHTPNIEEQRN